jgi:hypothetical protein
MLVQVEYDAPAKRDAAIRGDQSKASAGDLTPGAQSPTSRVGDGSAKSGRWGKLS